MTPTRALQRLLLWTCVALTGCSTSERTSPAPGFSDQAEEAVRTIGRRAVRDQGIVGLSIGIAINGNIVFCDGFGHADINRSVPATAETIYDVASIGKHVTAAAILQLEERGALALNQRVRSFVPDLPGHFPNATIEQLLRHTSGFVSGDLDEQNPPADYTRPRYGLELLTDVELTTGRTLFREDEMWVYSNAGYLVLGLVVEAASGMRYDEYVRENLLEPLEPHAMLVCEYAELPRGSHRLHRTDHDVAPVPFIHMTAWSGQGSVCSSVIDLLRWSDALNTRRIIDEDSLIALRSPTLLHGNHTTAAVPYGMAQRLGTLAGTRKVGHTGTFDGGSAALAYYPDAALEIAVLSNTYGGETPHARDIETAIAKVLLGITDPEVESLRVPVTDEQRRAIEGTYTADRDYAAIIEGDELVVIRDGREIERLVHVGDMRFRSPEKPDVFQWFVPDGDSAGWWVYNMSGSYIEVLRRVDR